MLKEELLSRFDILRTEYIKLLNDKDVLVNWGKPQLEALYATRIGVWQVQQLQLELRVKSLKRKIEMVRSVLVRNLPLDVNAIELEVAAALAEAELQIMQQVMQVEAGKKLLSHLDTPQRSAELRQVFRLIAKQLHPDVNPDLSPAQLQVWHLANEAYRLGDLERLKALQVVYESEIANSDMLLQQLTEEQLALRNETLIEGIKILQAEVDAIRSAFPFDMEQQIKDEDWVAEQQEIIKETIDNLRELEQALDNEFKALIHGYGGSKPGLN